MQRDQGPVAGPRILGWHLRESQIALDPDSLWNVVHNGVARPRCCAEVPQALNADRAHTKLAVASVSSHELPAGVDMPQVPQDQRI
jgi:hypothetical protein